MAEKEKAPVVATEVAKAPEKKYVEITHDFCIPRRNQLLEFHVGDLIDDPHMVGFLEQIYKGVPKLPFQYLTLAEFEART